MDKTDFNHNEEFYKFCIDFSKERFSNKPLNKERLSAQRAAYAVAHKDVIRERDKEYKKEYLNRDYVKTRNRVRDVKNRLRRRLGIANPPEMLVELICAHNDLRRLIDEKCK